MRMIIPAGALAGVAVAMSAISSERAVGGQEDRPRGASGYTILQL